MRSDRTVRSETKYRSGFIFRLANPASLPSDEAGIYQPTWSNVGGKFNEAGIYQPTWSNVGGKFTNTNLNLSYSLQVWGGKNLKKDVMTPALLFAGASTNTQRAKRVSILLSPFEEISVVIVTFNSGHILANALNSIPARCEIIVVDNASGDDSLEVARRFGATYIQNKRNLGFGGACNIGAAASKRKFILFLNPDAVLKGNALMKLLETLTMHSGAAAVGPKFITESGQNVWRYQSILHPLKQSLFPPSEPEGTCCVPLLTGAAILCRRNMFEDIGGFDEKIFMYFEDDDLSKRLVDAGGYLIYEPEAEVLHDFGMSSGHSFALTRMRNKKKVQSQIFVMKKYGYTVRTQKIFIKTIQRLIFSLFKFDMNRLAASIGVLDGLREIRQRVRATKE